MVAIHYLGVALISLAAVLLVGIARNVWRRLALFRNPVRVKGEVVRVRHVEPVASDASTVPQYGKFYPTVRYKAEDGHWLEKELPPSGGPDKWKVGQVLRLVYQRGNPSNVVDERMRWADLVMTGLGSLIILAIGVAMCLCEVSPPAGAR
jgi:hypothetical protein